MTEPNEEATSRSGAGKILKIVLLLAILSAVTGFFAFGGKDFLSIDTLRERRGELLAFVDANWALAALTFVALYAVLVAFSIPLGIAITPAAGFLFGAAWGTALSVAGAGIGATGAFLAARFIFGNLFREKLLTRAGPAVRKMEAGFRENQLNYMFVLRLVPLFPFWLVNIVPAFLGVGLVTYLIGTFVGIIPGAFVYALVGNGLGAAFEAGGDGNLSGVLTQPEVFAPIIGLIFLSLIPVAYKKLKKNKKAV